MGCRLSFGLMTSFCKYGTQLDAQWQGLMLLHLICLSPCAGDMMRSTYFSNLTLKVQKCKVLHEQLTGPMYACTNALKFQLKPKENAVPSR